ncbi:MAG: hypothetical protein M1838_002605 [Thelocarpon superellum]|nr:MAG: hypothetical protein M1838_002605 [Thelocarpon superellum]
MSMDAGGLAQMTYSNFPSNGALGVPGSGFATRGKGSHIARLSVPQPAPVTGGADEGRGGGNTTSTPRTSRSHLLANLRTAPKSPSFPPSAPPVQMQHHVGLDGSKYADPENARPNHISGPKTSIGARFPTPPSHQYAPNPMATLTPGRQMYSTPEQVLAPPSIQIGQEPGDEQMDPNLYAELVATNLYLAQQQQRLQQQLINVTAAAQQFGALGLNEQHGYQAPQMQPQFVTSPAAQQQAFYNQQQQNLMQPVISPVPGAQPGLYSVYNPLTGQQGFFVDPQASQPQSQAQPQFAGSPTGSSPEHSAPPQLNVSRAQSNMSPPAVTTAPPTCMTRNTASPKTVLSPTQATLALPPPSANAFRRGHKQTPSNVSNLNVSASTGSSGASKLAGPKSAGYPVTPMTGTFGPGQGRAGEHPVRQPRGPPPLEELIANPTTKHEGSKNFATRQRRRAVHSLVRAGIERRGGRSHGSTDSVESMTPVSEAEITFLVPSDNDSESLGSGSLSGKPSLGSLRAVANGAIGSERKELKERSRERDSLGSHVKATSVSSEEGAGVGGKVAEVKTDGAPGANSRGVVGEVRKTPMLVLTSAEKRKSSMF